MKGTAPRSAVDCADNSHNDDIRAAALQNSEKDRAENVMIVDMIRNDLSKIACRDSVRVEELCAVERYPTVYQMTSTVVAKSHASLAAVFRALFPCASITGAPKVSAMRIIHALESSPRGIYTGAIGFISPQRTQFSVAIRTAVIEKASGRAEYGVGSGVVWDSSPHGEYSECLQKASIVLGIKGGFELFETLRWDPSDGYAGLMDHVTRLTQSARFFGWWDNSSAMPHRVTERLLRAAEKFGSETQRVRVLLSPGGLILVRASPLVPLPTTYTASLATRPVLSGDIFLRHKTTHRAMYDLAHPSVAGCDDIIFWNERGELTESRIANLIVDLEDELVTPSVSSGLLPGIKRAALLEERRVKERSVMVGELRCAKGIYLLNSVRGIWPIQLLS